MYRSSLAIDVFFFKAYEDNDKMKGLGLLYSFNDGCINNVLTEALLAEFLSQRTTPYKPFNLFVTFSRDFDH